LQFATVRPSTWFYPRFSLPMVRSPGFGSIYYYYGALFRLAFTTPPTNVLSLQQQITRWIVLQKARRHRINRLRLLVRTQFQDLFHSPSGVLLTFPSRYLFTIDRKIYLALEGGPPRFSQGFTCPDLLDNTNDKVCETWYTRLSLSMAQLSNCFCSPRKFLTLCRAGGSICFQYENAGLIRRSVRTGCLYVTTP
jgi:hypothetical protein